MLWSSCLGQVWGFLNVTNWAKLRGTNWAKVIFGLYLKWFQAIFFLLSYHFVCVQLSANFLKIAFFKKKGCKSFFLQFVCFKFNFENALFYGLLKHYNNRGFSQFLCFIMLKEKRIGKQKMITGISGFWVFFFRSKMAVSWRTSVFQKCFAETLVSIVFFGCALFGPSCRKKGKFWTPTKKKKKLTDNWKALFLYILFLFFCLFFLLEGLRVRWGGPKGHLTWP